MCFFLVVIAVYMTESTKSFENSGQARLLHRIVTLKMWLPLLPWTTSNQGTCSPQWFRSQHEWCHLGHNVGRMWYGEKILFTYVYFYAKMLDIPLIAILFVNQRKYVFYQNSLYYQYKTIELNISLQVTVTLGLDLGLDNCG